MSDVLVLTEAMRDQVLKPSRAVVNSESSFVAERLRRAGHTELAREYWSWTCSYWEGNPKFGPEVQELQHKLREIDKSVSMPSWGTYGT